MRRVLPIIVIAQFLCTSVWFASNAAIADIVDDIGSGHSFIAHLTSAVQFGFITGTLLFAIFTIADRFSPSRVFFVSALLAAFFNIAIVFPGISGEILLLLRFLTGFFLAGIYPVGMKIASDHYQHGLGKALGFLVGALVLGTAFPYLVRTLSLDLPPDYVFYVTSILSAAGGILILVFVPDGPFRKRMQKMQLTAFLKGFKEKQFRSVAMGYFGHMWELYTFWAFVPIIIAAYNSSQDTTLNIPLYSFIIIGSGMLACFLSGICSMYVSPKKLAAGSLATSGLCCLVSPVIFLAASPLAFLLFLLLWGLSVIADSPLFSSLVARYAPEESRGSALTIVNCIGFAITIVSIQFLNMISDHVGKNYLYMFLAIGPLLGLLSLASGKRSPQNS